MQTGWIKLHRKLLEDLEIKYDQAAFRVFVTLLLLVDKNTGSWDGGREQLATHCGLHPLAVYRATKRLEKMRKVNRKVNSKFTVYYICNWATYQAGGEQLGEQQVNNKCTTSEHSNNNKELRIKNKEIIYTKKPNKKIIEALDSTRELLVKKLNVQKDKL